MAATTKITELASTIYEKTGMLNDYFAAQNLPTPTLDASAPLSVQVSENNLELQEARIAVIEACEQLRALVMGARDLLAVNVRRSE